MTLNSAFKHVRQFQIYDFFLLIIFNRIHLHLCRHIMIDILIIRYLLYLKNTVPKNTNQKDRQNAAYQKKPASTQSISTLFSLHILPRILVSHGHRLLIREANLQHSLRPVYRDFHSLLPFGRGFLNSLTKFN